jgi:hypothetical protein
VPVLGLIDIGDLGLGVTKRDRVDADEDFDRSELGRDDVVQAGQVVSPRDVRAYRDRLGAEGCELGRRSVVPGLVAGRDCDGGARLRRTCRLRPCSVFGGRARRTRPRWSDPAL